VGLALRMDNFCIGSREQKVLLVRRFNMN